MENLPLYMVAPLFVAITNYQQLMLPMVKALGNMLLLQDAAHQTITIL
jgi:hypothetical protein